MATSYPSTELTFSTNVAQNDPLIPSGASLDKIKSYAAMPDVQERFAKMCGDREGRVYLESVLIAVANSEKLQKCTARSIMIQALRAASMHLSVDPAMRQAHLAAYGGVCTLIVDYHEMVYWTEATGFYSDPPHVSEIYAGELVKTERLTGRVTIEGERTSDEVIGWLGYFRSVLGSERFLYMTNEQCDAWGKKYNPGGFASPKSVWNTERDKMRRKTVLRQLVSRYGRFTTQAHAFLQRLDSVDPLADDGADVGAEGLPDDRVLDLSPVPVGPKPSPEMRAVSEKKNMHDLGFEI